MSKSQRMARRSRSFLIKAKASSYIHIWTHSFQAKACRSQRRKRRRRSCNFRCSCSRSSCGNKLYNSSISHTISSAIKTNTKWLFMVPIQVWKIRSCRNRTATITCHHTSVLSHFKPRSISNLKLLLDSSRRWDPISRMKVTATGLLRATQKCLLNLTGSKSKTTCQTVWLGTCRRSMASTCNKTCRCTTCNKCTSRDCF